MTPKRLVLTVEAGPEKIGKALEAVRVALGVHPWGGLDTRVVFHQQGLQVLDPGLCPGCFPETFQSHLSQMQESGIPILYVGDPSLQAGFEAVWKVSFQVLGPDEYTHVVEQSEIHLVYGKD